MAGTAMKIRWVLRHNPQNRLLPPKYYAAPVFAGRRDAGEMIRQIAGRSVLSAGDIVDAFANAGEVAANWLAAGCSVELPEIGSCSWNFRARVLTILPISVLSPCGGYGFVSILPGN